MLHLRSRVYFDPKAVLERGDWEREEAGAGWGDKIGERGKRKGGGGGGWRTAECQLNGTRNRGSDSQQQSWEGDVEGRTKEVGGTGGGAGWGERELSEKYRESDSGKSRNCRWRRRKALYCRKLDTATERLYYFIPLSRARYS